jgi:hypothetical protein
MIFTPHKILLDDPIKNNEVCSVRRKYVGGESSMQGFGGEP